jgi:hypothetical protein
MIENDVVYNCHLDYTESHKLLQKVEKFIFSLDLVLEMVFNAMNISEDKEG